jgi:serpin B
MKLHGTVITTIALFLFLSGCGRNHGTGPVNQNPGAGYNGALIKSSLQRDSAAAPLSDVAAVANGNNAFGWSLLGNLQSPDNNIFFSPYSVTTALAMTWVGARGETYAEMARTLKCAFDSIRFHAAMNTIDLALASRGKGAAGNQGQGFALRLANSLWGEQSQTFLPGFLDPIALYYGGGVHACDFINNSEQARLDINAWVSQQTSGKIKDLIPENGVDMTTKLVLTNTVYFDAAWADSFLHESTVDGPFVRANGDSNTARFMHKTAAFGYAEDQSFQALELPYDGRQVSMVFFLPKSGHGVNAADITYEEITGLMAGLSQKTVVVTLPKFGFTYGTVRLKQPLINMGMIRAFESLADFSGIDGQKDLCIDDVLHQAYVAVDEKGTTAAAATGVVMVPTCVPIPGPDPNPIFTADHPFLFFIRDIPTGQILFMGYLAQPVTAG